MLRSLVSLRNTSRRIFKFVFLQFCTANATLLFTVPATMFDKEGDKTSLAKNKKNMIFEVTVTSSLLLAGEPNAELFQASLLCGDLFRRNQIAIGKPSETIGGAMNSLLRLTMTELALKKMPKMLEKEHRPEGVVDKKYL